MSVSAVNSPSGTYVKDFFASTDRFKASLEEFGGLARIRAKRNHPASPILPPIAPQLSYLWKICQIGTFPGRFVAAKGLRALSWGAVTTGISSHPTGLKHLAKRCEIGFQALAHANQFLVKKTCCIPNEAGYDIWFEEAIEKGTVTDETLRSTLFSVNDSIEFDGLKQSLEPHNFKKQDLDMIGRGMSLSFLYFYLQTFADFSDRRAQMEVLGKQFSKGGGRESVFLNACFEGEGVDTEEQLKKRGELFGLQIKPKQTLDWFFTAQTGLVEQLAAFMQDGEPLWIRSQNYEVACVKCNDQLAYYFDPNFGIIEVRGSIAQGIISRLSDLAAREVKMRASDRKEADQGLETDPLAQEHAAVEQKGDPLDQTGTGQSRVLIHFHPVALQVS